MMRFAYLSLAVFVFVLHWLLLHPLLAGQHSTSADEIDAGLWIFVCFWILLEAIWLKPRAALRTSTANKRADMWAKMRTWFEEGAGAPMTRTEAQAELNRQSRQMLDNMAGPPASSDDKAIDDIIQAREFLAGMGLTQSTNHMRDAILYGQAAQKIFAMPENPTMQIRMHRGSIDAARKTEETIPAELEAVRAYLVRHDWPEALVGNLEVVEYSLTPGHGWDEHHIILLNKIPVGFTSAPVEAAPIRVVGVDLAKPGMDHTAIIVASRQGGRSADAVLWGILGDGMITPEKVADVRPQAVLRARRKGKKFTYDRVEATA